ncbi:VOC family protein [soil metagenome]
MSIASNPLPNGWPRISSGVTYEHAAAAIDWLCRAFGFEIQLKVEGEGGTIVHSELVLGGGMIMVGDGKARAWQKSPNQLGGACTQALCVYVDDVDEQCERARAAGAVVAVEPKNTDYGDDYWIDRSYEAVDLEGHHWWFMQRLRGKTS